MWLCWRFERPHRRRWWRERGCWMQWDYLRSCCSGESRGELLRLRWRVQRRYRPWRRWWLCQRRRLRRSRRQRCWVWKCLWLRWIDRRGLRWCRRRMHHWCWEIRWRRRQSWLERRRRWPCRRRSYRHQRVRFPRRRWWALRNRLLWMWRSSRQSPDLWNPNLKVEPDSHRFLLLKICCLRLDLVHCLYRRPLQKSGIGRFLWSDPLVLLCNFVRLCRLNSFDKLLSPSLDFRRARIMSRLSFLRHC